MIRTRLRFAGRGHATQGLEIRRRSVGYMRALRLQGPPAHNDPANTPPAAKPSAIITQMRCRECAAEVPATARVCSRWGAPIVGQPPVVADTVVADRAAGAVPRGQSWKITNSPPAERGDCALPLRNVQNGPPWHPEAALLTGRLPIIRTVIVARRGRRGNSKGHRQQQ
jgi:hypothetical protein